MTRRAQRKRVQAKGNFAPSAPVEAQYRARSKIIKEQTRALMIPSWIIGVTFAAVLLFTTSLALLSYLRLPSPSPAASTPLFAFSEERVREDIRYLSEEIGQRPVGSDEWRRTIDFLQERIANIQSQVEARPEVHIDMWVTNGTSGMFSDIIIGSPENIHYGDMTNVVVRVNYGKVRDKHALLLCSHFDTKDSSPGASDDGVGVGVMLEIIRNVANGDRLENSLVFVFDGAEEVGFLGAHAFVKSGMFGIGEVKEGNDSPYFVGFINLEASGGGGREILFQSATDSSFLAAAYAQAAPHPFATSLAQDLFDRFKLIPSDTDFRVLRDDGHLPGLDFATIRRGYIYHTPRDSMDFIDEGCLQHYGDNILAVTRLVCGKEAEELESWIKETKDLQVIFFDLLGWMMMFFRKTLISVVSLCVIVVALLLMALEIYASLNQTDQPTLPQIMYFFGGTMISLVVCLFVTGSMAFLLHKFGCMMCWFSIPWMAVVVYGSIAGLSMMIVQEFTRKKLLKDDDYSRRIAFDDAESVTTLRWTLDNAAYWGCVILPNILMLFLSVLFGLRLSYMFLIPLVLSLLLRISVVGSLFVEMYYNKKNTRKNVSIPSAATTVVDWILITCIHWIPTFAFLLYTFVILVDVFIPMSGRMGMESRPDVFVAVLVSLFSFFILQNVFPACHRVGGAKFNFKLILGLLILVIVVTAGLVLLCPNRYSFSSPRRVFIQHTVSEIAESESGLWGSEVLLAFSDPTDTSKCLDEIGYDYDEITDKEDIITKFLHSRRLASRASVLYSLKNDDDEKSIRGVEYLSLKPKLHMEVIEGREMTVINVTIDIDSESEWFTMRINVNDGSVIGWTLAESRPVLDKFGNIWISHVMGSQVNFELSVSDGATAVEADLGILRPMGDDATHHVASLLPRWAVGTEQRLILINRILDLTE